MDELANDEIIRRYLRHQRNHWRPSTRRVRACQLGQLARAIQPATLQNATEDVILFWHEGMTGSPETISSYTSVARGLYKWMNGYARPRLRADDPTVLLRRPHVPARPPRPMSEERYERALTEAEHERDEEMWLWLALMGCCGLRCCELAWMRVFDVEELPDGAGLAHVIGKGGKRRTVPIGSPIMSALRPYLSGTGTVFRRPSDGQPYTPTALSGKANRFLRSLGIADTAHSLRHRFGTDYHKEDPDLFRQALLMGHSSVVTTQGYTELEGGETLKHIEKLTRRRLLDKSKKRRGTDKSKRRLPPDDRAA